MCVWGGGGGGSTCIKVCGRGSVERCERRGEGKCEGEVGMWVHVGRCEVCECVGVGR